MTILAKSKHPGIPELSIVDDRFIREAECKRITGLSRTRRWELEKQLQFPQRYKLGERAVAWRLSEILNWMEERTHA